MQRRQSMQRSTDANSEMTGAAATVSGLKSTVKLTRVPSPTVEETRMRSLFFLMFGRPRPAPKPSARAS